MTLAETYGFEGLLAAGNIFRGFCRVMRRDGSDQAREVRRMGRNLQRYEDNYGLLFLPYFHGVLAEARLALEDHDGALRAAAGALEMVERYGEMWWRSPLLDIKAEAATRGGLADAAEIARWRHTATETAKAQQAGFMLNRPKAWPPR